MVEARKSRSEELITALVYTGVDLNEAENGMTALHHACKENYLGVVKLLVEGGADKYCMDPQGNTPLHIARNEMNREIVKYLCAAGFDVNITNITMYQKKVNEFLAQFVIAISTNLYRSL